MVDRSTLDRTLFALADPSRRGIIDLLRKKPRNSSALAEALGMTRPAMSRHLRVLRKSGLVKEEGHEKDARFRMYHLEREPFRGLLAWLMEVNDFWYDQLSNFKLWAEGGGRKGRGGT